MLVASSPIVPDWPFNQILPDRCTCRPVRSVSAFRPSGPAKLLPAAQAGAGPVRRVVGFRRTVPSAWRFQPFRCFRCGPLPSEGCIPTVPLGASIRPVGTGPSVAPSGPRRFGQRLRATRGICGSPSPFRRTGRGVFSDAAAGIAAASFGLKFPMPLRGLLPRERGNFFPFDERRLRLATESCKKFL